MVLCNWGRWNTNQLLKLYLAIVRARQTSLNLNSYFQLFIFNQQRLWADELLFPQHAQSPARKHF